MVCQLYKHRYAGCFKNISAIKLTIKRQTTNLFHSFSQSSDVLLDILLELFVPLKIY